MSNAVNINVASLVDNLDHDDGRRLLAAMQAAFDAGSGVLLDFSGLDVVTPSLLNTSLRVLAKQHDIAFLKSRINIVNSNRLMNDMIRAALNGG